MQNKKLPYVYKADVTVILWPGLFLDTFLVTSVSAFEV